MQAKVNGHHFKVGAACILADVAVLGGPRTVLHPGCKLTSTLLSHDDSALIVLHIKSGSTSVRLRFVLCRYSRLTHRQLPGADHGAVVEVTLGSPFMIFIFPSEEVLRPKQQEKALSSSARLQWFVRATPQNARETESLELDAAAGSKTWDTTKQMLPYAARSAPSK